MIKKNTITVLKQVGIIKSKLGDGSLFVEPVKELTDLSFWEKRLNYLKLPYILAEFEVAENTKLSDDSMVKVHKKRFGIFADPIEYDE